jgi:hypothetical protein
MSRLAKRSELVRPSFGHSQWFLTFWLLVTASWLPTSGNAQAVNYGAPITITQGGTYTGNYQSLSSSVPCVRIATNAPVILDGCMLSGAGNLIQSGEGANVTIRNCVGQALAPTVDNQAAGRFLDSYRAQNLTIEHNTFTGTSGIVINRWSTNSQAGQTLTVRYNKVRNIDGRWRNGGGSTRSSFLILNTVQRLSGVDVAYNEVINTPDQSLVEDNINLYNSSGTAQSAIHVHDNFVRGAYPFPATAKGFTGTGMTTDGDGGTLLSTAGYIEADHNQFVSTGNAAMNLAAGHDVYYHDNRAVTSGTLPDGRRFNAGWAGIGVFNYYNLPLAIFFNNRVENNTIGYVSWGANSPYQNRQDQSPGACAPCNGTVSLPNPITTATEDAEASAWQQKLQQAGVTVGPIGSVAPTPVTSSNTVVNPSFDTDGAAVGSPTGWLTKAGNNTDASADYTEAWPGAHTGTYHGTHYRPDNYEVYTYQTLTGLANGTYTLSAWVKSSGGQPQAQLRARNYGGIAVSASAPATPSGNWVQVTLTGIAVSNGTCEIGLYSRAKGGQWMYFDDVELAKQNTLPTISLTAPSNLTIGQPITLSATATDSDGTISKVEFFSGSTKLGEDTSAPYQITWSPSLIGLYSLKAIATDNAGATTTSATVATAIVALPIIGNPAAPSTGNLAINPSFDADGAAVNSPTGWLTQAGDNTDTNADYTEAWPGAHSGTYHGTHYRPGAYEVYTYQTFTGLAKGTYTLSAWVKSSGGQSQAQLRASNYGGSPLSTNITATSGDWVRVEISNIGVNNGKCEIGFYSQAQGGQWLYFDDVTFAAKSASAVSYVNTVLNASFDDDQAAVRTPNKWSTQTWGSTQAYASYTEAWPGAHTGTYHGTHYRPDNYEIYTYQVVDNLQRGTYTLKAWVKSSGGQSTAQLQASKYGGPTLTVAIPATPDGQWAQVVIPNFTINNGSCELGFYSKASGGQSIYFDDVELVQQDDTNLNASVLASTDLLNQPTLYPNPAVDQTTITTTFTQATSVDIIITNMQGTTIAQYQRQGEIGDNQFDINTSDLPSGLYVVLVRSNQASTRVNLEVRH